MFHMTISTFVARATESKTGDDVRVPLSAMKGIFLGVSENMWSKVSEGMRLMGRVPFNSLRTTDIARWSDWSRTPS